MNPELSKVLEELKALEPIFHWPGARMTRDALEGMTTEDFWEVGASGKKYSRAFVLEELERRRMNPQPDVWETSDFACRELADGVYLLTYTLVQDHVRVTRRTTIWQRSDEGWKIVFHQGTIVRDA